MAKSDTSNSPHRNAAEVHTIDAAGKSIGRVATEAAHYLMGKHRLEYAPHKAGSAHVHIIHAGKLAISEKKRRQKRYARYSGYPGGLRYLRLEEVLEKKGAAEVLRHAIRGMLPKNRLRKERLKRVKVEE